MQTLLIVEVAKLLLQNLEELFVIVNSLEIYRRGI